MASPKLNTAVSEESMQVLDSSEPLVTASSSVPSCSVVLESIEPLVSARAQALDSIEPLLSRSSVSDLEELDAVPSEIAGPSEEASGTSDSPIPTANSSEDDESGAAVMPRLRSPGRIGNPNSDEIRKTWNWNKILKTFGTHEQCVQFAEERGLIATQKTCYYHKRAMTFTMEAGQLGKFRCRKSNCRMKAVSRAIGTWFENARLPLTNIFKLMYAFSEGLSYYQARKQLADETVLSTRTVGDWYNYCRKTLAKYELEKQRAQGKEDDYIHWCEKSWRRRITAYHLDAYEELLNAIKHVYKI